MQGSIQTTSTDAPLETPYGPSFYAGAHGFSIGTQYNIGHQSIINVNNLGLLDILNPIADASHSRNRRTSPPDSNCLPGTRQEVIRKVVSWADGSLLLSNSHIMWLYGYVGCGKSAIAQAVAEKFADRKRLAASYFFFRGSGDRSKSTRFAATVASQVAAAIPSTARHIEAAVKTEAGLLEPNTPLSAQFHRLVYEPIKAVKWDRMGLNLLRGPFLIVVDGLDECEDREEVAAFIDHSVEFFQRNPRIPLRLFITSRVEEHLRTRLETSQVSLFNLVDHTTLEDIQVALRATFSLAAKHNRTIQAYGEWPAPNDLRRLVDHISRSFIFMSTIVKFILGPADDGLTPMKRLPLALNMNPGLDGLYAQTLSRAQHLPHFFDIIRTIALLEEPLSILELANLLNIGTFEVVDVLIHLHSILHVPGDDTTPVTLCHSSLHDFLHSQSRSGCFYADRSHHKRLAYCCMTVIGASKEDAPAFEYAKAHCGDHWQPYALSLSLEEESRRSETRSLIHHFWHAFGRDAVVLVVAAYILVDPETVCAQELGVLPFNIRSRAGLDGDILAEFTELKVPAFHARLMLKALESLGLHSRWDRLHELEVQWRDIDSSLPPLRVFYHDILSFATRQILKLYDPRLSLPGHDGLLVQFTSRASRDERPIQRLAFSLAFVSWAKLLALSHRVEDPYTWDALIQITGQKLHTIFDSATDHTVLHILLQMLSEGPPYKAKEQFVKHIGLALEVVQNHFDAEGPGTLQNLQKSWVWKYHGPTKGWCFGSTRVDLIMLDVLVGFSVLVRCLQRDCDDLHGASCPLRNPEAHDLAVA